MCYKNQLVHPGAHYTLWQCRATMRIAWNYTNHSPYTTNDYIQIKIFADRIALKNFAIETSFIPYLVWKWNSHFDTRQGISRHWDRANFKSKIFGKITRFLTATAIEIFRIVVRYGTIVIYAIPLNNLHFFIRHFNGIWVYFL